MTWRSAPPVLALREPERLCRELSQPPGHVPCSADLVELRQVRAAEVDVSNVRILTPIGSPPPQSGGRSNPAAVDHVAARVQPLRLRVTNTAEKLGQKSRRRTVVDISRYVDGADVAVLVGVVLTLARLVQLVAEEAIRRRTSMRPSKVDLSPEDLENGSRPPRSAAAGRVGRRNRTGH